MNYYLLISCSFAILVSLLHLFVLNKMNVENYLPPNYKVKSIKKIESISNIVVESALTYIFSQAKVLFLIQLIITTIIYYFNSNIALWFFIGSLVTWFTGFIAMYLSVKFNKKVALFSFNYDAAFNVAFLVGQIISFFSISLILITSYLCYYFSNPLNVMNNFIGLSFGASLISVFARIGGGIFTKAADMGADLSGKIDNNMKEDDPRNPAVIADMLGDAIGDAFGMCADLSESYIVILSSAIFMFYFKNVLYSTMFFNILSLGLFISIISLITGWKFDKESNFTSLNLSIKTFVLYSLTCLLLFYFNYFNIIILFNLILGVFYGCVLMPITELFTSSKFSYVKEIVKASSKGDANNILQGLITGYKGVSIKIILLIVHLILSYFVFNAGFFGLTISCLSMISISPIILALDGFGPITDNAGGLVEMSELTEYRPTTDLLDVIGNKNKAATKGFAIYSSAISAFILSKLYQIEIDKFITDISLYNIFVFLGMLFGIFIISNFVASCLSSVNFASMKIIEEVKLQIELIKRTNVEPNYQKAINILTTASIKGMILPTLLPIILILICFALINYFFKITDSIQFLAGLMISITLLGILISISMTISGAAWDNAKKDIEINGKKNSSAHKAAVTGDIVGDPFKDTVGPAINPLIKMINLIIILLVKIL